MNSVIADHPARDIGVAINNMASPENTAALEREPDLARPQTIKPEQENDIKKLSDPKINTGYEAPEWKKKFDRIESISTWITFAANLIGAPLLQTGISDKAKKRIESFVNTLLNLSFSIYGANGMVNGYVKRNIFTVLGFFGEMISPWLDKLKYIPGCGNLKMLSKFGNLQYTYVLRGLPTAMDQLWVATDPRIGHKYPGGMLPDFITGAKEVWEILGTLTKEFINAPFKTMFTLETGGHHAFLSSVGSAVASVGLVFTGIEKIFGNLRDFSGPLFDWAMLVSKNPLQKVSGVFFMIESAFDFMARFFTGNWSRVSLNMLSHACGRLALMLYKNSDSVSTVTV